MKTQAMPWPERTALAITDRLTSNRQVERLDYLKCKLGLEMMLINVSKLIVVYALAFLMQVAVPTLLFHLAFLSIRTFAYGVHAKSSLVCTFVSSLFLVGIPFLITDRFILLPLPALLAWGIFNAFFLAKYAPASTAKNAIGSAAKKKQLRRKALASNAIVVLLAAVMPSLEAANLLVIGSSVAVIFVLPLTYRLFDPSSHKE
ncbi:accessory gene regulator B family protein [Saccharibacillus alkalitolerans]|uniref:AgrB-like protein n=1 Tax=Saccharibacillus alkalitolerans TaxID=2705290 RepID=A0ABX0F7X3_9BACL|nr:accessory gene regulator B family protein [Saccharibacillus alkalitolerans]NGZ75311.1 hypothetical protein [Saccharibacillus alkalitolerans]